jgi:cellulose synthase/poly-beta-1,6-N-acetylglucosamine synthase-like glycosyltransferase
LRARGRHNPHPLSYLLIGVASVAPVLYPLWVAAKSHLRSPPQPPQPGVWLGLTVIVPAYLEREVIGAKLDDLRGQDYPGALQLIVVAEDVDTAEAAGEAGAEVIAPEERLGKAEAINRGVAAATQPIVVITDANARLAPGSLSAIARWFEDPAVGAVAGEKQEEEGGQGLYWRFESWLNRQESRDGTTVGLVGELAAVRRSLFRPIPADVAVDDLWIALDVIEQGGAIRYEPKAVAREKPSPGTSAEWERRTRTTTGVIDVLWRRRHLLVPGSTPAVGKLWGHKLMRSLLGPLSHAGLLVLAVISSPRSSLARWFLAAHLLGAAALVRERGDGKPLSRPARLVTQFLFLQATALGGAVRYASGDRPGQWPKTDRPGASAEIFD